MPTIRKLDTSKYNYQLDNVIDRMIEYGVTSIIINHDLNHYNNSELMAYLDAFDLPGLFIVHTKELSLLEIPYDPILLYNKSISMTKVYDVFDESMLSVCVGTELRIINDSLLGDIKRSKDRYNSVINTYTRELLNDPYHPINVNIKNKYELARIIKALSKSLDDDIRYSNMKNEGNGYFSVDLNLAYIGNTTIDVGLEVEDRRRG